jgi:hypothetical protein
MSTPRWEWVGQAPAFPVLKQHYMDEAEGIGCTGITKLELFTALAMNGLLAGDAEVAWTPKHLSTHAVEAAKNTLKALYNPELLDEE